MGVALQLLLFPLLLVALVAYEAPEDKKDVFAWKDCPAFLVFDNVAYLAHTTVELPCHCKPEDAFSVVWYHQKQLGSGHTVVLTDFGGRSVVDSTQVRDGTELQGRFSIRLFSLLIFRAQEADSGYYICGLASRQFFYAYYVDVQMAGRISVNQPPDATREGVGQGREREEGQRLTVFTREWSKCDRCGVDGEQTLVGLCYVQSPYLHVRYRNSPAGVAPCGSPAVPTSFRLPDSQRGAQLAVRGCHVPCPAESTLPPQRKSVLAFLGYSGKAAQVPVHYQNHAEGSHVALACPGAKSQQAIGWDRGPLRMYRAMYMEGLSNTMQVYIDAGGYLHFHPLMLSDRGSYYCWLEGKIAAEVRLGVYLPVGVQHRPSDPRSVYALKIILISYTFFTAVFVLLLVARFSVRYFRMQKSADNWKAEW